MLTRLCAGVLVTGAIALTVPSASAASGTPVELTGLPGATGGHALAVNERGQATGDSDNRAVLWHDGTVTPLAVEDRIIGLNDRGQVLTYRSGPDWPSQNAAVWSHGKSTELLPGNNGTTIPGAINNRGQVAVLHSDTGGSQPDKLGVWQHGRFTRLVPPPSPAPGQVITGGLINDRGQVAAAYQPVTGGDSFPFRCTDGTCVRLPVPAGVAPSVRLSAIDAEGRIAGTVFDLSTARAVLWTADGRVIDLGTLGGSTSRVADGAGAINAFGHVVGTSETADAKTHAFIWRDGRMTDLGTLGGQIAVAEAINDRGDVVGWSETAAGEAHAFSWRDGRMTDLGTLGGSMSVAKAVNDSGEIVGWSERADYRVMPAIWTSRQDRRHAS